VPLTGGGPRNDLHCVTTARELRAKPTRSAMTIRQDRNAINDLKNPELIPTMNAGPPQTASKILGVGGRESSEYQRLPGFGGPGPTGCPLLPIGTVRSRALFPGFGLRRPLGMLLFFRRLTRALLWAPQVTGQGIIAEIGFIFVVHAFFYRAFRCCHR
jgi:hypothetical protein